MEAPMKLDEILKKHFCGWKDSYHLEEDKEGTKLIIAHAHREIIAWIVDEVLPQEGPYPKDIFTPLTKKQYAEINGLLREHFGFPIDRLSGNIGRELWKLIISQIKERLKGE